VQTADTDEDMPVVRPATVDDVQELVHFWAVAAENAHRPADDVEAATVLIERDADALLLAVEGSRIVGSVIAGWDGWRAHLYRLAVHPEVRRRGIAGLVLDAAEERLASLGARRFDAMVLDDNTDAHEFWLARGFRRQDEWGRWVKGVTRH
jgi:ribosomal protein S18 acetylase RimI-like enzyme